VTRRPRIFSRRDRIESDGPFGNGHAAERIVAAVCELCESRV
jgi:hypothetical protein